jgi:hypothetical protein
MSVNYKGTYVSNVLFNSSQLDKLKYNGITSWENWIFKTGDIGTGSNWETNNVNETGQYSRTWSFGETRKLHKAFLKAGTASGVFILAGIRSDGSLRTLITLSGGALYFDQNPKTIYWTGEEADTDLEFTGYKVYSAVGGHYRAIFDWCSVYEWYEKGN